MNNISMLNHTVWVSGRFDIEKGICFANDNIQKSSFTNETIAQNIFKVNEIFLQFICR